MNQAAQEPPAFERFVCSDTEALELIDMGYALLIEQRHGPLIEGVAAKINPVTLSVKHALHAR